MQKIVRDWQQDLGTVVSKIKIERDQEWRSPPGFKLLLQRKLASPSSPEIATSVAATADKHGTDRDELFSRIWHCLISRIPATYLAAVIVIFYSTDVFGETHLFWSSSRTTW